MIFEHCGGLVIVSDLPATCPKCGQTLQEPQGTPKQPEKVTEVPSWSDDALEALYDAKYSFGSDSTTVSDGFRVGFELGMSIVNHSDVWENQGRLKTRPYAPRGLYLYKDKICKDCGVKYSPQGGNDHYCQACGDVRRQAAKEQHYESVRLRRKLFNKAA